MEVVGGVMIMLVILGLLLASVWLSLPILLFGLWRRMDRLELRIAAFERRLDRMQESLQSAPHTVQRQDGESTGRTLDGTA